MNRATKTLIRTAAIVLAAAALCSLVPVVGLYLMKDPPVKTNMDAIRSLGTGEGGHFAFIVFGDNHAGLIFNDSATLKLVSRMNREDRFKKIPIDFVASAGDITVSGSSWQYRTYNKIRSIIKWPVISAIGNHDDDNGGSARFEKLAGASDFSYADRNSYFIFIDNITNDLTEAQFTWIEEELEKGSDYKHRFIVAHKSPISPYYQSWYRPELSPWSYRFMKLCEKYKVDIVFSGHEHIYSQNSHGGVKYIVTGGGGMFTTFPSQDGGFFHYVIVRVYGDYVDYEVRKVFPPLWEYLVYYMWKDAFYLVKDAVS